MVQLSEKVNNEEKVLLKLFEKPEYHFHLRELARETDLNPNTIVRITDRLAKKGLVIKKRHKQLVEIYCSYDSPKYKRKKQLFNIALIEESGLLDRLIEFYNHPKAIILFGSYFRGEDWFNSDVDVAVVTDHKKEPDLVSFEKKLKRNVHLVLVEYGKISEEFYNNLINGFVLYGYLKDERIRKISGRKKS